jgi:hypothetical protein
MFDSFHPQSKVWIYQAEKPLSTAQHEQAKQILSDFVQQWQSHGKSLKGDFAILHDQFVVLSVDESGTDASGCSIDSSVAVIRKLEEAFGMTFLDKSRVPIETAEGIELIDFREIKPAVSSGKITPETIVYDHSVNTLDDFRARWKAPAASTWLKRYFKTVS